MNERVKAVCDAVEKLTHKIDSWMDFGRNLSVKILCGEGLTLLGVFIWYTQSLSR